MKISKIRMIYQHSKCLLVKKVCHTNYHDMVLSTQVGMYHTQLEIQALLFKTELQGFIHEAIQAACWCSCNVPVPTGIRTWTDSPLWVASQRSNQLGQSVRPAGEKLAGRLDCHIPPFLNGTRHPCLATRHSHQAREKHDNQSALSELSVHWAFTQACGRAPNVMSRYRLVFEPGLIAHSESRASALSNSAKGSDPLARS